jgi:hypothetical protein
MGTVRNGGQLEAPTGVGVDVENLGPELAASLLTVERRPQKLPGLAERHALKEDGDLPRVVRRRDVHLARDRDWGVTVRSGGHSWVAWSLHDDALLIDVAGLREMAIAGNPTGLLLLRCALLAMVVWGTLQAVATVFNIADASMGLMATINLIAVLALSGTVVKLTRDYFNQRKAGVEPRFHGRDYPELGDGIDHTIWTRD